MALLEAVVNHWTIEESQLHHAVLHINSCSCVLQILISEQQDILCTPTTIFCDPCEQEAGVFEGGGEGGLREVGGM